MTTLEEEAIYQAALRGDSGVVQEALRRLAGGAEGLMDVDRAFGEDEETLLHAASRKGHAEVVGLLTKAGADPNAKNKWGATPLQKAYRQFACAELLLQAGANPNAKDKFGATPFHWAVSLSTTVDIVNLFLENGADVRAVDNDGETVLHCASGRVKTDGCTAVLKLLLENGAGASLNATDSEYQTPLHYACHYNNLDVAKGLLACDDIDLEAKDEDGNTPLHLAAMKGRVSCVELFLDSGADLEATNENGCTPLHLACFEDSLDSAKVLIDRCPTIIFSKNNHDDTPLDGTIEADHISIINYLLRIYAEEVIEQEGNLALHSVLRQVSYEDVDANVKVVLPIGTLTMDHMVALLEEFVSQFPDCIGAQDTSVEVALHVACHTASPIQVVRFLVEQDVDSVNSRDRNGATPLHHACRAQHASTEVLRFLVDQNGAALSLPDSTGSLPLHVACSAGLSLEKVQFLIERGGVGTLTARDGHGALPLHVLCASSSGVEVVEYLVGQHSEALYEKTMSGDLPIMVACEHSAPLSVVYGLIRAHPGALIN